ncbi:unnamed protein product [Peniophora sp. CBMAI 1063]|nr:unnamed protein product [Peniophora sp. CBMAI 1063]
MSRRSDRSSHANGPYKTVRDRLEERDAVHIFNRFGGGHQYTTEDLVGLFGGVDEDIWDAVWPDNGERWRHSTRYVQEAAARVRAKESDEQHSGTPPSSSLSARIFDIEPRSKILSRVSVVGAARAAAHEWRLSADEAVNCILAFDEVWRPNTRIATLTDSAASRDVLAYDNFMRYFYKIFLWPELHRRLGWGDLGRKEYREWRRGLEGVDLELREGIERRAIGSGAQWD